MKRKLDGVCSEYVTFLVAGGRLKSVKFHKGCPGNLQALAILLEGMPVGEAVAKLKGIRCGAKKTSCSDQLARVLEEGLQPRPRKKSR